MKDEIIDIETIDNKQNNIHSEVVKGSKITKRRSSRPLSIDEKRHRNNISARKHRQRKLDYVKTLEKLIKDLELENKILYDFLFEYNFVHSPNDLLLKKSSK
tara:strand:- start:377 stop:682 length:306 start_codon:yes stop_codon:yes gene_type:complete